MRYAVMASLISGLVITACSVVGIRSGTEEPRYSVIDHVGAIEIRRYDDRLAAETSVEGTSMEARSAGFRRLAGYIFGGNTTKTSIAMTAPVAQSGGSQRIDMTAPVAQAQDESGAWVIRFYLPASVTKDIAPTPNDGRVRVVQVPSETVAVLRYSGSISPEAVAGAQAKLIRGLLGSKYATVGAPMSWFYDPPWTLPPLRRNEAVIDVSS